MKSFAIIDASGVVQNIVVAVKASDVPLGSGETVIEDVITKPIEERPLMGSPYDPIAKKFAHPAPPRLSAQDVNLTRGEFYNLLFAINGFDFFQGLEAALAQMVASDQANTALRATFEAFVVAVNNGKGNNNFTYQTVAVFLLDQNLNQMAIAAGVNLTNLEQNWIAAKGV